MTEAYKQTEGEPQIIRRAKALANALDNITIFIEDGELIVGNTASKPMGLEIAFWDGTWIAHELDGLKQEQFELSNKDEAEIKDLAEYWRGKTCSDRAQMLFNEEKMWPFVESGMLLAPWKRGEYGWGGGIAASGMGLSQIIGILAVDYEKVLNTGLRKLIEDAEEELKNIRITDESSVKKAYYLKAVIIALSAVIRFAKRFGVLAEERALKEKDPTQKKDLIKIAEICQWVPENPARSFHEAIQAVWFIFLMLNPSVTVGFGRMDQYLNPFYKKDAEEGRITQEEAVELLQCLRIKDMQLLFTSGRSHREKWAGMAKWHNCIIGGQTPDGEDATNELSYLILEAAKRCPTPHHTITVRVHDKTPETLMLRAQELVRSGIGMPAFIGDKAYIEYLLDNGVPLKWARDYIVAGCLEANLTKGRSRSLPVMMFIVPRILELTLNNGADPRTDKQVGPKTGKAEEFKSFDDLMRALKAQLTYFSQLIAEFNNILLKAWSDLLPDPVCSALMFDGIKVGRDYLDRTFPFENGASLNVVGMINTVDSLAALKKLVFEDGKITMDQLKDALAADWKGYEDIRKMCLAAPKYGNDDDYADSIAKDLYQFWADRAVTFDTYLGGKHKPSAVSISAQWPGGAGTGATPDGRYAGECLADGSMSPMRGRDRNGPTAVIKSASKIDQVPYQSTLMNIKFHPSALESQEDLRKLGDLTKTYFSLGGKHVQFNVVNRETLLEAQEHPEDYSDLVVRVAGYSAYFVKLSKPMQDEIIGRTEHH
jgi:formate C-acetyltransferase